MTVCRIHTTPRPFFCGLKQASIALGLIHLGVKRTSIARSVANPSVMIWKVLQQASNTQILSHGKQRSEIRQRPGTSQTALNWALVRAALS